MKVVITGTPGTGKTKTGKLLAHRLGLRALDVNDLIREKHMHSGMDGGSLVADLPVLEKALFIEEDVVLTGHLLSDINVGADIVFVLRTNPKILALKLEERKWPAQKIRDNAECEALDYCTQHVLEHYDRSIVHEIDCTHLFINEMVDEMIRIIEEKPPSNVGLINWSDFFMS